MSDDDPLDRAIETRYGFWGLLLVSIGGLVFVGALGGLIMNRWEGTLGYTLGFVGMCVGLVGVLVIAVVAACIDGSSRVRSAKKLELGRRGLPRPLHRRAGGGR